MQLLHPNCKWNENQVTQNEFLEVAYLYLNSKSENELEIGKFILNWFSNDETILVQTSGTTGKPKLISVKKEFMINSALATGEFFDLKPNDKALCCLPVKYIAGKMMLVRAFVLGLDIYISEPNSNPLQNYIQEFDFVAMVPLQVENSIEKLHLVKQLLIGGSKIGNQLKQKLKVSTTKIYESYSMTETVTHVAVKEIHNDFFSVLPNVSIKQDDRNCLVINAPKVSSSILYTNDVVEILNDNQFKLLGRIDNVVNSGGIKLFPEQIEEKLETKIYRRFFLAGLPDERLGEMLVLFVEGIPFEISTSIFENLTKYEIPKEIIFIPEFLETETGKIKRKEIIEKKNRNTT